VRLALGISYQGQAYAGWQSQRGGNTVQDQLEAALSEFAAQPVSTVCAGRTDAGVHGLMQVAHLDTELHRSEHAWVRGTNRFLPTAIARRYAYCLLESPVRPSVEAGRVGWVFRPLDAQAMQDAAQVLIGEHDFSSFRAAECQARSPVKQLTHIHISRRGAYWRFDFQGNAFLHHMIRNIMGCLVLIGEGRRPAHWMAEVLAARQRSAAAPTFSAAGLYFVGPIYEAHWGLPSDVPAYDSLP
jgi:tRNA pseudouridine38-40 synthase